MKLQNKVALITGAGTGIGAAIAKRFVEEGAKIVIMGRRKEKLEETAANLPAGSVKVCQGDVANADDVKRAVAETLEFGGGKIDVLVNCAGVNFPGSVTTIDLNDWQKFWAINVNGPFMLMRETIPHMQKAGGGSIINIASIGGLVCLSERVGYCTTKAALIMLTKQAARDFGADNIRCNVVCPGFVLTPMTEGHFGSMTEDNFIGSPMKRGATPDEITGICVYLASEDASYTTGAVITVDGGSTVIDGFEVGIIASSK
ncbi:MAG: SDR family oxidoreductase [Firmicutes bacterium]|nr:SDR family oxidoreductase [Bacillota bacterium]